MSRVIPLLMVLYNNDALEVRYSDGSSLQLSSCGSTMIHHASSTSGGHRERVPSVAPSSSTHKRSRFVTSEHRHKVLQAMDFRNRFAERPYHCEELLEKEEIVALYANIEAVSWPQTPEGFTVEVLQDGSRKVNSLDEYASLVVSPHGHDFTVCYLSKLSLENEKSKQNLSNATRSESSRSSLGFPQAKSNLPKVKILKGQMNTQTGANLKSNEAVVHPFQCAEKGGDLCTPLSESGCATSSQSHKSSHEPSQSGKVENKHTIQKCLPKQLASLELSPDPGNPTCSEGDVVTATDRQHFHNVVDSRSYNVSNNAKVDSPHKVPQGSPHQRTVAEPFPNNSLNSQDISSISRSSTPDGLRTMVDSDATLGMQDSSASAPAPDCSNRGVYKQRHSSPTHFTSSPYEEAYKVKPRWPAGSQKKGEDTHGGSYIDNEQDYDGHDGDCKVEQPALDDSESERTLCEERSPPPDERSRTVIGQESDPSPGSLNSPAAFTLCPKTQRSPAKLTAYNCPSNQAQFPGAMVNNSISAPEDMTLQSSDFTTQQRKVSRDSTHKSGSHAEAVIQPLELSRDAVQGGGSEAMEKEIEQQKSNCRHYYVWTTIHGSKNDCPHAWAHALKLALAGTTHGEGKLGDKDQRREKTASAAKSTKPKGKYSSPVPAPLPVTCPFQHLHKWDADKTLLDVTGASSSLEFQHGMLKVVISEGIVYRFTNVAGIHVVEVHPGDGSIIVSQGVKGHFFTHYVVVGDQLEERTYSLKSLPPGPQKGRYSISKLVQTATRYLLMNHQWERRGLKQDLPCWKREVVAVVEPLSSSLLEECVVEGVGKFSAFTNGRVRAVFEDRTALDMVCNFTRRVSECLQHSQEPQTSLPAASRVTLPVSSYQAIFGASSARLLLPSGQYVTVDIQDSGQYKSYIQAGQEWASWVNSTPMERHEFYTQQHLPTVAQQAAEHELKKIFCFNYILEQTLLMQQDQDSGLRKSPALSPRRPQQASSSSSSNHHTLPRSVPSHGAPPSSSPPQLPQTHVYHAHRPPPPPPPSSSFSISSDYAAPVPAFSRHSTHPSNYHYSQPSQGIHSSIALCHGDNLSAQVSGSSPGYSTTTGPVLPPHSSSSRSTGPQTPNLLPTSRDYYLDSTVTPSGFRGHSSPPDATRRAPSQPAASTTSTQMGSHVTRSDQRVRDVLDGFQAVRQVLLRNSSLINDIDDFLDNTRNQDE